MGLIICPDCQKEVSDKATVCIHCGCPLNSDKVSMSKTEVKVKTSRLTTPLLATIIVVLIAFGGILIYNLVGSDKGINISKSKAEINNENETLYSVGLQKIENELYAEALTDFLNLNDYKDSANYAAYCNGILNYNEENYQNATDYFKTAGSILNAESYYFYCDGKYNLEQGNVIEAISDFRNIPGFLDSSKFVDSYDALQTGIDHFDSSNYLAASTSFENVTYYFDAEPFKIGIKILTSRIYIDDAYSVLKTYTGNNAKLLEIIRKVVSLMQCSGKYYGQFGQPFPEYYINLRYYADNGTYYCTDVGNDFGSTNKGTIYISDALVTESDDPDYSFKTVHKRYLKSDDSYICDDYFYISKNNIYHHSTSEYNWPDSIYLRG